MLELDNNVCIGQKELVFYVTGVITQFTFKGYDEVKILARGKFISKAVDVAEIITKKSLAGSVELKSICIDSAKFSNEFGEISVSTIEITLKKVSA